MENEGQDDLIVIGRDEFRKRWAILQARPILPSCLQRAEQLRDSYSCFRFKQNNNATRAVPKSNRRDAGGTKTTDEYPSAKSMRPRIGMLFTNTEGKARKNFVAFMNKLSPQNKEDILGNFVRSLVPDNIDIYMDQIVRLFQVQPTYHELYMEVLHHIIALSPERAREFMEERFSAFVGGGCLIPDGMLECMDGADTADSSDRLCEYTRWKKQTKSLVVLYVHMLSCGMFGTRKDTEALFALLAKVCDENWNNPCGIDIYLDITLTAVQALHRYTHKGLDAFPMLAARYRRWDDAKATLRPASRFKVMDILETMNVRSKKK